MNIQGSFTYHENMVNPLPGAKNKSRLEIKDDLGISIFVAASRQKGSPNVLKKHFFTYIKSTDGNGVETFYKINKNSFVKRLGVPKKELKSGIYDSNSLARLLEGSSSNFKSAKNSDILNISKIEKEEFEQEEEMLIREEEDLINEEVIVEQPENNIINEDLDLNQPVNNNISKEHTFSEEETLEIEIHNLDAASALKQYSNISSNVFEAPIVDPILTKKQEFEAKVSSVFKRAPLAPGTGEIVVTGFVLGDGMGDYFHMRTCANKLSKQYPGRPVRIIAVSDPVHTGKLTPPKGKESLTHIGYGRSELGFPQEMTNGKFDPKEKINNASLVVMGPVGLDRTTRDFTEVSEKAQKGIKIAEYDYIGEDPFYDKVLGMGLSDERLGLFSPTAKDYSWDMLENGNLRSLLFENNKESVENREVFFSYVGAAASKKFINHAVAISSREGKDLDVISPSKNIITREGVEKYFDKWRSLGVGSVKIVTFDGNVKTEELVTLSESGKQLRIINSGSVGSKDFKILTKLSNPLMACTGDKSLEKVLLYGKIPVYDVRGHKAKLYANLLREMKERLGPDSILLKYSMSQPFIGGPEGEEAENILANHSEKLIEEAKIFGTQIMQDRSFNSTLLDTANEQLYMNEHPELKSLKAHLNNLYMEGDISLQQVEEILQEKIDAISNSMIAETKIEDLENRSNKFAERALRVYSELVEEGAPPKSDEDFKKEQFENVVKELLVDFVNPRLQGRGDIVLMGYISDNGLDEYTYLQNCAKDLETRFPNSRVQLIVVAHPLHENKLETLNTDKIKTHIAYSESSEYSNDLFAEEGIINHIEHASVAIMGPGAIGFSGQKNSMVNNKLKKGIKISAYDDVLGKDFLYDKNLKMGLSKKSLGIIVQPKQNHSWSMLKNDNLKELVFGENRDAPRDNTSIFYSNVGREATCKFVDQAICFSVHDKKNIQIISTSVNTIIQDDFKSYTSKWAELGVGSLKIISIVDGLQKEENIQVSEKGKQVTLINNTEISKEDQQILTDLSGPLMACTSDLSISEAFSLGKIPAYDLSFEKTEFYANLLVKIRDNMGSDSTLFKYCINQAFYGGGQADAASDVLINQTEEIIQEAKIFGEKMANEKSFNSALLVEVNRKMSLEYCERDLKVICKEYVEGSLTLEDVREEVESLLPKPLKKRQ